MPPYSGVRRVARSGRTASVAPQVSRAGDPAAFQAELAQRDDLWMG